MKREPITQKEVLDVARAVEAGKITRREAHKKVSNGPLARACIVARTASSDQMEAIEKGTTTINAVHAVLNGAKPHRKAKTNGAGPGAGPNIKMPSNVLPSVYFRDAVKRTEPLQIVAKDIGVDDGTLRRVRSILLLAERTDLSDDDLATVKEAVALLDANRKITAPYNMVKQIADRVWGNAGGRKNLQEREKQRLEHFEDAIHYLEGTCERASEIIAVPHLDRAKANDTVDRLKAARANLNKFIKKVKDAK